MSVYIVLGRGELALARGRAAEALSISRDERHVAIDQGLRNLAHDFELLEADALRALGDFDGARVALMRGVAASNAIGSRRLLWQFHGGLAALAATRGDADEARRQREKAAAVVDHIARSLRQRGLDETFRLRAQASDALGRTALS